MRAFLTGDRERIPGRIRTVPDWPLAPTVVAQRTQAPVGFPRGDDRDDARKPCYSSPMSNSLSNFRYWRSPFQR